MGYCELLPKCANAEAIPMRDLHGVVHRQRVQQFHKGCAGGGGGYVEVKHDVVHGEGQATFGRYEIVILQRGLSSPFVLKRWKAVLLDIDSSPREAATRFRLCVGCAFTSLPAFTIHAVTVQFDFRAARFLAVSAT